MLLPVSLTRLAQSHVRLISQADEVWAGVVEGDRNTRVKGHCSVV